MKKHIISTLLASTLLIACSDEPIAPPTACLTLIEEAKTLMADVPDEMKGQMPSMEKFEEATQKFIDKWDEMPEVQRKTTLKQCESKLQELEKMKALLEQFGQQ